MKKTTIVALIMSFVLGMAVSGATTAQVQAARENEALAQVVVSKKFDKDGGWQVAQKTKLTKKQKKLFNKAVTADKGVKYTPVAYLGSQVVAGINHCFLCKTDSEDSLTGLAMVYVFEGLDGKAKVYKTKKIKIG